VALPDWHERYDHRVENPRLPEAEAKREAYAVQVGADGFLVLDALDRFDAPEEAPALPAVAVLRRVWARHFERAAPDDDGVGKGGPAVVRLLPLRTRDDDNRPIDRIESPYDTDARFRTRAGREWVGYIAHFTETCDEGAPRLVVHAETTDASVHEAMRIGPIHDALAGKGLGPSEHLVDAAYVAADQIVAARTQHGIDLIGPQRRNMSWQGAASDAFDVSDFAVDWDERVVRCPEGKQSAAWATYANRKRPHRCALVQVRFRPADCRACPSRARCTRAAPTRGRYLMLYPRPEHETLVAARARERTAEYRSLYAQRQGIESMMSQGVRAFGLRRARYRGLAKAGLQHLATAAALNLDRIAAWLAHRPLAPTRVSRFAAIAA